MPNQLIIRTPLFSFVLYINPYFIPSCYPYSWQIEFFFVHLPYLPPRSISFLLFSFTLVVFYIFLSHKFLSFVFSPQAKRQSLRGPSWWVIDVACIVAFSFALLNIMLWFGSFAVLWSQKPKYIIYNTIWYNYFITFNTSNCYLECKYCENKWEKGACKYVRMRNEGSGVYIYIDINEVCREK